MEELEGLSLVDLRLIAKKMGVKSVTAYRKQELLDLLKEKQKEAAADKVSDENAAVEKKEEKGKAGAKDSAEAKDNAAMHTERPEKKRAEKNVSPEHIVKEDDNSKRNAYNKKSNVALQRKTTEERQWQERRQAGRRRSYRTPTEIYTDRNGAA